MEIGIFGIYKHNREVDKSGDCGPTARMELSGYTAGLAHIAGQPWTHHVYIDLVKEELVVLPDAIERGPKSGRYYHRQEIPNGKIFYLSSRPDEVFIKDDNGSETAEVKIEASAYGQSYEATVTLPGGWKK